MIEANLEILTLLQKNNLFSGFSQKQLEEIIPLTQEIHFAADQDIIREGHASAELYIIKHGEVEVLKKTIDGVHTIRLTTLGAGEAVGETALLDNSSHSVSVRTLSPTTVLCISSDELKLLSQDQTTYTQLIIKLTDIIRDLQHHSSEHSIHSRLLSNIAVEISGRLRRTNQLTVRSLKQELDHSKMRVAMGYFLINILIAISIYIFAFKTIGLLAHSSISTTIISVPVILMFAGAILLIMKGSGYPLQFYGLTLEDWPKAIKDALLYTLPWLMGLILFKWMLINLLDPFQHLPLFEVGAHLNINHNETLNPAIPVLIIIGYLILTPIQELIARGALQSSLQEFLTGPNRIWWAIFISNLLFSMAHVHISLTFAAAVFIPGLFWGWLYSRHKTLLGVCLSHLIIGGWAFFILGYQKVLIV